MRAIAVLIALSVFLAGRAENSGASDALLQVTTRHLGLAEAATLEESGKRRRRRRRRRRARTPKGKVCKKNSNCKDNDSCEWASPPEVAGDSLPGFLTYCKNCVYGARCRKGTKKGFPRKRRCECKSGKKCEQNSDCEDNDSCWLGGNSTYCKNCLYGARCRKGGKGLKRLAHPYCECKTATD